MGGTGCESRGQHKEGSFLQRKVQSFPHDWHLLMQHHSRKVLASYKSHAHWPFLTKMFMHSYDLIKATLKNKRKVVRKEWATELFKIAAHVTQLPPAHVLHLSLPLDSLLPCGDKSLLCAAGTFQTLDAFQTSAECAVRAEVLCHRVSVSSQEETTNP